MKLEATRIAGFLRNPGESRVILLYGEDAGLVRERAELVVRSVAGALDDPFRVVNLERDGLARLASEMAAQSLMGGRRVVRVRDVTDAAAGAVAAAFEVPGDTLLILEAAILATKSRLRQVVEQARSGVAIDCPREVGQGLEETIRAVLSEARVTVDHEALHWLATQLGGDRSSTRAELEKLVLFAGPGGAVDLDVAMAVVGDAAGLQLDDALYAATAGQIEAADRALEIALAEGLAPIGVLRMALGHMQRLHRVRAELERGTGVADAMRAQYPPVYLRRSAAFKVALRLWSITALAGACQSLWEAEQACKRTGGPVEALCRNALLGIARRAARSREVGRP
jgi:DNA polymerase-3 subunit delta